MEIGFFVSSSSELTANAGELGSSDTGSEVRTLPKEVGSDSESSRLPSEVATDTATNCESVSDDANEVNECYSTYEERINQTPRENSERGEWTGKRGESKFIPSDPDVKEILKEHGLDGVDYKDGMPDFSECSESTVEIDNMTERRLGSGGNFEQCDQQCAEKWNQEKRDGRTDWTARDVADWRAENGHSWHERNDMKTCDLVSTRINDYFGHLGGVSECKKRDTHNSGGDEFDE